MQVDLVLISYIDRLLIRPNTPNCYLHVFNQIHPLESIVSGHRLQVNQKFNHCLPILAFFELIVIALQLKSVCKLKKIIIMQAGWCLFENE